MKKSVCIGILCVLVFGVSLGVGLKLGFMQTNAERYAELWKIKLPQGMTEVYSAHSKNMALGDGVRYTAFEAEKADTFSTFVQENVEFPQDELETTLKQIGVPEESMPPFEENLSGKILEKEDDAGKTSVFCTDHGLKSTGELLCFEIGMPGCMIYLRMSSTAGRTEYCAERVRILSGNLH